MSTTPISVPVPDSLAPQMVSFRVPRFSFTLHNARKKPLDRKFDSNLFTIPAVNETGPRADTDADGDLIPGTCVIEDIYVPVEGGGEEMILSSVKAVQYILGIKPGDSEDKAVLTSRAAIGGLSLLPRHSTKEQWKEVAENGANRAFLVEVDNARIYINTFDENNAKRGTIGVGQLAPDFDYRKAITLMNEYNKLMQNSVQETLAPHEADAKMEELELEANAKAIAMDLAERASEGKNIDKMKLFEQLVSDPKVLQAARKKGFRIRRKGHLEANADVLKQAAEMGKTVDEMSEDEDQ